MNVASNDDSGSDRGRGTGDTTTGSGGGSGGSSRDGGIGAGNGVCGVRVLQQQHSLQPSRVQVTCHQGKQVIR